MLAAFAVVMLTVCLCWFYFYSGDLPNFAAVAKFAPDSPTTASSQCFGSPVQVIPSTLVGKNLHNAARAAEGNNDEVLARQISFDLFCNSRTRSPSLIDADLANKRRTLVLSTRPIRTYTAGIEMRVELGTWMNVYY